MGGRRTQPAKPSGRSIQAPFFCATFFVRLRTGSMARAADAKLGLELTATRDSIDLQDSGRTSIASRPRHMWSTDSGLQKAHYEPEVMLEVRELSPGCQPSVAPAPRRRPRVWAGRGSRSRAPVCMFCVYSPPGCRRAQVLGSGGLSYIVAATYGLSIGCVSLAALLSTPVDVTVRPQPRPQPRPHRHLRFCQLRSASAGLYGRVDASAERRLRHHIGPLHSVAALPVLLLRQG